MLIRWRAFELRPEPVERLDPQGPYLTSAWQHHVYPLARQMNMPLQMPTIQPRSRLAHEAAKWAGSQGQQVAYTVALFQALFECNRDIGDHRVLMDLAATIGLDPGTLARALDNHAFTDEVVADEEEARQLRVRAVPSFVCNHRILAAGVQTAERLRELLALRLGPPAF